MSAASVHSPTHVVSCFLLRRRDGRDEVLLVRRSDHVRTYRRAWGAVSGYLEPGVVPVDQAYTEIQEEVGLERNQVQLLRAGEPIAFHDQAIDQDWVVHPFLFAFAGDSDVQTDWEATTHAWVPPIAVSSYSTVPMLAEALAAVYLPWVAAMHDDSMEGRLPPNLSAAIRGIREDREHGASWLAQQAAQALADTLGATHAGDRHEDMQTLRVAVRALATARPSMAAVANTVARIWAAGAPAEDGAHASEPNREAMRAEAQRLLRLWDDAADAILRAAEPVLTGRLYTLSRSRTVEQVLVGLVKERERRGESREIVVSESRPGGEGVTTARALAGAGWHVLLIADTACGQFMPGVQAVATGADSVRADGSIVNKVGTYPVALAARAAGVAVYAVCETLKIATPDFPLTLEEMDPAELLAEPVAGVTVRNVYFDHTPAELVTGIITEQGLLSKDEIARLAHHAGEAQACLLTG